MNLFRRLSNPTSCEPGLLRVGSKVRFPLDDRHHAHGCVEQIVYGGAWVKLDDGQKLFVKKKELRGENPAGFKKKTTTREQARKRTRKAQHLVDSLKLHETFLNSKGLSVTRLEGDHFEVATPEHTFRRLDAAETIETIRWWL